MRKLLNIFFAAVIALSSSGVVFAEEGDIEQFSYDFAPDIDGAEYFLTITDITDSTVTFHIEYVGAKLSYEYAIEEMTADLAGNKADFLWEDSWFNSGTGS
ncbi:MAG: hypothetical protein LUH47_04725, partial [Clostridiales bacterium]|nr:hypothetical protein [Clostridiales bacterium]